MTKAGDQLVRCCNKLNRYPSLAGCFLLILLQACLVDYYLVHHLAIAHLFWAIGDLIVLILVLICFIVSARPNQTQAEGETDGQHKNYTVVWVTWALMQALLAAKVVVICTTFSTELDEANFFGPNTLKTAVALGSCIFVLLLTSQHDASPSSSRRRYIEELTGTVIFDILDTADILDVMFDEDERPGLSSGIPEMILVVATLNLLLPTVPLITLSKTKFGLQKLQKRLVYLHRLFLVLLVNVPNLVVRMLLWHGFTTGISPFVLKNIIIILMTAYEFYEHKKEKFEEHKRENEELKLKEMGGDENKNRKPGLQPETGNDRQYNRGKEDSNGSKGHHNSQPNDFEDDGVTHFDIESRMVTAI